MVELAWTFGRKILHCRIKSGYTYNGTSRIILRSTRHHGPVVPSYFFYWNRKLSAFYVQGMSYSPPFMPSPRIVWPSCLDPLF